MRSRNSRTKRCIHGHDVTKYLCPECDDILIRERRRKVNKTVRRSRRRNSPKVFGRRSLEYRPHNVGAAMRNPPYEPPQEKVYQRVTRIEASKEGMPHDCDAECLRKRHRYFHEFEKDPKMYGFRNGDILLRTK